MGGDGPEGLEAGFAIFQNRLDSDSEYAVLDGGAWVSSDAGTLWINGIKNCFIDTWTAPKPRDLKEGDKVRLTATSDSMEVLVNGERKVLWESYGLPADGPLYAIV